MSVDLKDVMWADVMAALLVPSLVAMMAVA